LRDEIHHGLHQVETVQMVEHGHVEGRSGRAFFLVAAHV
jgi:hypothetical protein